MSYFFFFSKAWVGYLFSYRVVARTVVRSAVSMRVHVRRFIRVSRGRSN